MTKQKGLIIGVILVAIILMAVGYAAVGNTPLNITTTATASANSENFKVHFTGTNTKKSSEVQGAIDVTVTNGSDTATVNFNKALGLDSVTDSAYVILEIENASDGIDAESVTVTTEGEDTSILDFTAVMCKEDGTPISDYKVDAGDKTYVKVSVELLQTPTTDVETTTTVTLTAKPKANV